jgi:hypothetical protein
LLTIAAEFHSPPVFFEYFPAVVETMINNDILRSIRFQLRGRVDCDRAASWSPPWGVGCRCRGFHPDPSKELS